MNDEPGRARVYEVWRERDGKLEMCIDENLLRQITSDGYLLCEATVEMLGHLVNADCRIVAIPRTWVESAASPDDWRDAKAHWRPQAA